MSIQENFKAPIKGGHIGQDLKESCEKIKGHSFQTPKRRYEAC